MSSIIAVCSNEGETILPDVEELSEFHPDRLSSIEDIQEELEKLEEINIEEVVSIPTVDDVNIVDHEVTIVADQSIEVDSIFTDNQEPMVQEQIVDSSLNDELMEENLDVGETITIGMPSLSEPKILDNANSRNKIDQVNNQIQININPKVLAKNPTVVVQPPPLKAIRPLPEALISPCFTMAQDKKNIMTKIMFSPNNSAVPDGPIIFGDRGGQTIRLIGQNKTILTNSPKTITFSQAKEMGLISPNKLHQLNHSKGVVKKGVMVGGNKQLTMVRASPTKILPLPGAGLHPIAPSPTINMTGSHQKVFIRQGGTIKTGTISGTIITSNGGPISPTSHVLQLPLTQDNNTHIHQILPGKQVQFVRLVNSVSTANVPPPLESITTLSSIPISSSPNTSQLKMLALTQSQASPISTSQNINSFERVMVSPGLNQLSGKQDKKPASNVVMVPAEFVKQYKPVPTVAPSPSPPPVPPAPLIKPVVLKAPVTSNISVPPLISSPKVKEISNTKDNFMSVKTKTSDPPNGIRPRKPCNCTKSQCLKFVTSPAPYPCSHTTGPGYCDCFANGEFCHECNCNCCFNNLNHEEERQRAIKACLDRNPSAFRPKIGKGYIGNERRHNKGCNCKRSGCLKNYCECYEAKIPCSNNCKCFGCRNVEDCKDVSNVATSEGSKISQQLAVKNKLSSEIQESAYKPNSILSNLPSRQPFNLMTQEVVEATCQCLLAQVEGEGQLNEQVERLIIEEFGRCLVEIIDCATRTSLSSST